eukprot:TRINITY_DN7252_c0_g1_i1.p1 TRINITY_DN7252_c0_g1~~TRINITY_DN7252_c0_g1_i1.p1  ORF type:complete len:101 (-),score=23.31 TRINITY_DN7252_c0_g1_i1:99-401(-)
MFRFFACGKASAEPEVCPSLKDPKAPCTCRPPAARPAMIQQDLPKPKVEELPKILGSTKSNEDQKTVAESVGKTVAESVALNELITRVDSSGNKYYTVHV